MKIRIVAVALAALLGLGGGASAATRQGSFEGRIQGVNWVYAGDRSNAFGLAADYLAHYTSDLAVGARAELALTGGGGFAILAEAIKKLPQAAGVEPYFGGLIGPAFHSGDGRVKLGGFLGASKELEPGMNLFAEFQMGVVTGTHEGSYFSLGVGAKFPL